MAQEIDNFKKKVTNLTHEITKFRLVQNEVKTLKIQCKAKNAKSPKMDFSNN